MNSTLENNKSKYLCISIGVVAIFLIWLFASLLVNNELVIPTIKTVGEALLNLLGKGSTYKIILFTILRVLISLLLGFILGIIFGVLASLYKWVYYVLSPIIKIMRVVPIASIILILLIAFGQNGFNDITFAPILVSLLLIIPIVFEAVYRAILSIDKDLIDVARLDAKNKYELVVKAYIPLINDHIETAIYQSIGLGIKVMVMAEYISQTQTSIGKSLLDAKTFLNYDYVFAWTMILIVICLLIEGATTIISRRKEILK